jgi:hypothetical protein
VVARNSPEAGPKQLMFSRSDENYPLKARKREINCRRVWENATYFASYVHVISDMCRLSFI